VKLVLPVSHGIAAAVLVSIRQQLSAPFRSRTAVGLADAGSTDAGGGWPRRRE